jgi:hypothetical protein
MLGLKIKISPNPRCASTICMRLHIYVELQVYMRCWPVYTNVTAFGDALVPAHIKRADYQQRGRGALRIPYEMRRDGTHPIPSPC